jgi:hypothetical protein
MNLFEHGNRRLILLLALGALLMLALTACGTTHIIVIDTSCEVFKTISWGDRDTRMTIDQIREHNVVWDRLCQSI